MAGATSILINVGASTASAVRGIQNVNQALQGMSGVQKAAAGVRKAALPAAAALTAIGAGAMSSVKAAEEAASANAALSQVFKSMGLEDQTQAALDYADALSKQIGVDDEVIKGAQTKLATFSEVAKNATLMGEATKTAADLAAAGFGSMDQASVMLGKALQDPTKGMTALSRVGVTFTDQQKEQIKAMQKSGDIAGAQAIIMKALKTQVGGVAEESATTSSKMSVAFGEVSEAVGGMLVPAFEKLAPLLAGFATWAQEHSTLLTVIAGVIGVFAAAILVANAAMAAWSVITGIWTAVTAVATVVGGAFSAVILALTAPITWIILAIIALVAVVVLLWKNWDTVTAALGAAWDWLWAKAVAVFNALKAFFGAVWNGIKAAIVAVWNGIKAYFSAVWNGILTVVRTYLNLVRAYISTVLGAIKAIFQNAWNGIKTAASAAFGLIKTAVSKGISGVLDLVRKLPGQILGALGNFGSLLYDKGRSLISGLIDGIKSMAGRVAGAIGDFLNPFSASVSMASARTYTAPSVTSMSAPRIGTQIVNATINVTGSPEENVRQFDRYLRRAGNRGNVTVSA